VFDAFPVRAAERVRDRADRVQSELANIAKRSPDARAVVIKNTTTRWVTLRELAPANNPQRGQALARLAYATVVLPVEVGGLQDGFLDGSSEAKVSDVAEITIEGQRLRQRVWIDEEEETPLIDNALANNLVAVHSFRFGDEENTTDEDSVPRILKYRVAKAEAGEPKVNVCLCERARAVEAAAKRIAEALALPDSLRDALIVAAKCHDNGKACAVWQQFARNDGYFNAKNPALALAKSERYLYGKALGGYRHEFGSLLDTALGVNGQGQPPEIDNRAERELAMHLIAAHHGHARPHFDPKAFDHERSSTQANEDAAAEVMRRFGQLQHRFGRWGLAWLESLLRCADVAASQQIPKSTNAAQAQGLEV